jgi:hypothetical protein
VQTVKFIKRWRETPIGFIAFMVGLVLIASSGYKSTGGASTDTKTKVTDRDLIAKEPRDPNRNNFSAQTATFYSGSLQCCFSRQWYSQGHNIWHSM